VSIFIASSVLTSSGKELWATENARRRPKLPSGCEKSPKRLFALEDLLLENNKRYKPKLFWSG